MLTIFRFDIHYFKENPSGTCFPKVEGARITTKRYYSLLVSNRLASTQKLTFVDLWTALLHSMPFCWCLCIHLDTQSSRIYPSNFTPSACHRFIKAIEDRGKVSVAATVFVHWKLMSIVNRVSFYEYVPCSLERYLFEDSNRIIPKTLTP